METICCSTQVAMYLLHIISISTAFQNSVEIRSDPSHTNAIQAGVMIQISCATEVDPHQTTLISLMRKHPVQENPTRLEERKLNGGNESHRIIDFKVELHPEDIEVDFYCEVSRPATSEFTSISEALRFNVTYPPTEVRVSATPIGAVSESVKKTFVCEVDKPGSNPPSVLEWTQLDAAGARLPLTDVQITPTEQVDGLVVRSNLTVIARRALNGRRFECAVTYQRKKTSLRSEEMLEVKFSPNNVRLIAQPLDGVRESSPLELTCHTSSCHPPPVIRWFELLPSTVNDPARGDLKNEMTDLAQLDTSPGEFGGTRIASKLTITNTYRTKQHALFQCQVEHPAMQVPIINKHRLQVLYPPSVTIVSLPGEPVVGQTVALSCQTSGGMPQDGFAYSWYTTTLTKSARTKTTTSKSENHKLENPNGDSEKRRVGPRTTQPELGMMIRLANEHASQLNISELKLSHQGWYACMVTGSGGESQGFHYLDVLYLPTVDRRTRSRVTAQLGETVHLLLYVDANPPSAEATWFQLVPDDSNARINIPSRRHHSVETFVSHYNHYNDAYDYDLGYYRPYFKKSVDSNTLKRLVGVAGTDRGHIVAEQGRDGMGNNLTFSLNIYGVREDDYGEYICEIRHHLGTKNFKFLVSKVTDVKGVLPETISLVKQGQITLVRFQPLQTPPYTRLVLRVCRRSAVQPTSSLKTFSNEDLTEQQSGFLPQITTDHSLIEDNPAPKDYQHASHIDGCDDYQIANPYSGQTEVHLTDAIQLYNFRLLLYRGAEVLQETRAFLWQPETSKRNSSLSVTLIILAVTGVIVFISILSITACLTHFYRNKTRKTDALFMPNLIKSSGTTTTSNENQFPLTAKTRRIQPGYELQSDLGSVRSYHPSEVDVTPLMQQPSTAMSSIYDPTTGSDNCSSQMRLIHNDYGNRQSMFLSPSPNLSALNNQILTEAYLAATRAASAAVASSMMSDTMDPPHSPDTQFTADERHSMSSSVQILGAEASGITQQQTEGGTIQHSTQKTDNAASNTRDSNDPEHRTNTERMKSDFFGPAQNRSSRLSIQSFARNASHISGTSYTSLNSQANLEAAARAAAIAAVASVMRNMNSTWMMQHAASAMQIPYLNSSRPASRAASVSGSGIPTASGKSKVQTGDTDSLHSAVMFRRSAQNPHSPPGEVTPTASLQQFEHVSTVSGSHLTVPVAYRQRANIPDLQEANWMLGQGEAFGSLQRRYHGRMEAIPLQRPMIRLPVPRERPTTRNVGPRAVCYNTRPFQPLYLQPTNHTHMQSTQISRVPNEGFVRLANGVFIPINHNYGSDHSNQLRNPTETVNNVQKPIEQNVTETRDVNCERNGLQKRKTTKDDSTDNTLHYATDSGQGENTELNGALQSEKTTGSNGSMTNTVQNGIVQMSKSRSNQNFEVMVDEEAEASISLIEAQTEQEHSMQNNNARVDSLHLIETQTKGNERPFYKQQPRLGVNSTGRCTKFAHSLIEGNDEPGKLTMEVKPLMIQEPNVAPEHVGKPESV